MTIDPTRSRSSRKARLEQLELPRHGGRRKGAGRKAKGNTRLVPHSARPAIAARHPLHVTVRLRPGLPSLRNGATWEVLLRVFRARAQGPELRLVHLSVQTNHIHLIVEVRDTESFSRGMRSLCIRLALALNRYWRRRGRVFPDRFHARELRTPREVRNALSYVLGNARKHGSSFVGTDPYSSAAWFDGWCQGSDPVRAAPRDRGVCPVTEARTWLLRVGWRRHGRLDPRAVPIARA